MRETRVRLNEIQPGEWIVRIGRREIGARFKGLHPVPPGQLATGPRGGRYEITVAGSMDLVAVETSAADRPLVPHGDMATVLRDGDDW